MLEVYSSHSHLSDFIDSEWYISTHAKDRITLSQCQWLHTKSNRQMCCNVYKQHTRWRLFISLHAWLSQNKFCRILCKTQIALWWDFIWPFTQRQHMSIPMIHLFSIWVFLNYIAWMHVEFWVVNIFLFFFVIKDYCPEYDPIGQTMQKDIYTPCKPSNPSERFYSSSDLFFCK